MNHEMNQKSQAVQFVETEEEREQRREQREYREWQKRDDAHWERVERLANRLKRAEEVGAARARARKMTRKCKSRGCGGTDTVLRLACGCVEHKCDTCGGSGVEFCPKDMPR